MNSESDFELRTVGPWSYYLFPALERAGTVHGFMTKSSDSILENDEEQKAFARALGAFGMVSLRQEHGDIVHVMEKGERPQTGDGLIVVEKGVIGVIKTADCLPVIFYAPDYGVAGIVHAGWRGTVAKIAPKALRRMMAMGAKPDSIEVLIGPGIGPCCYEIGEDVASAFSDAGFGEDVFERRGVSTFLDLKRANKRLVEAEGVRHIHDVGLCTSCRPDLFFSARRDRHKGRQISFVLLKG